MRFLHTGDWHVGKTLKGVSRADEHRKVLHEIASIAESEKVDLTIIAGDIFDSAAPAPEAEDIVYKALIDLAEVSEVAMVAGNHDHPQRLKAVAPVLARLRITTACEFELPHNGGVIEIEKNGEKAKIALIPFLSQRYAVRAEQLIKNEAYQNITEYNRSCGVLVGALCKEMDASTINIAVSHLHVVGGYKGPGQRESHHIEAYYVEPSIFPNCLQYVALGHLHAPQRIPGGCPIRYAGSPLQLDFGETESKNSVTVVDIHPRQPANARAIPLTQGRRLKQVRGTLEELAEQRDQFGDCYLKVYIREKNRPGLADEVRVVFPEPQNVLYVEIESPDAKTEQPSEIPTDISPDQLFRMYLSEVGKEDDDLVGAFCELVEEQYEAH